MFVESAGRQNVIAGADPADASGLTQILAQTGQSLLGMHINLARSRRLTAKIDRAAGQGQARARRAPAAPARGDRRPVRSAQGARRDRPLPPDRRAALRAGGPRGRVLPHGDRKPPARAGRLRRRQARCRTPSCTSTPRPTTTRARSTCSSGFGDDSSLYYWRVLGAQQIMRLVPDRPGRAEPADLAPDRRRLAGLRATPTGSRAPVRRPRTRSTRAYAEPHDPAAARRTRGRSGSRTTRASARSRASFTSTPRSTAACAGRRSTC